MEQGVLGTAGIRRVWVELGCSMRHTGAGHIVWLPTQLVNYIIIIGHLGIK